MNTSALLYQPSPVNAGEGCPYLFAGSGKLDCMTDPDFRHAFHANKDVLYRFVYRMTGSANGAEDIVQECFLALWRKPDAYDANRGALRAFLLGIARNLVLKRWRDDHPHDPIEADSFICGPVDLLSQERAEMVAQAVQMLPPLQRESIILAEYEDLTLEEIASATASTVAGVKSRLHRARANLRRMLAPLLEEKGTVYGTR
jgi:RNA polymerase sigma-70 factor, ECF subfamily